MLNKRYVVWIERRACLGSFVNHMPVACKLTRSGSEASVHFPSIQTPLDSNAIFLSCLLSKHSNWSSTPSLPNFSRRWKWCCSSNHWKVPNSSSMAYAFKYLQILTPHNYRLEHFIADRFHLSLVQIKTASSISSSTRCRVVLLKNKLHKGPHYRRGLHSPDRKVWWRGIGDVRTTLS